MLSSSIMALLVSPLISCTLAHYTLSEDYTGKAFYDGFEFFTDADPTNGHVKYVSKEEANNSAIAGLMSGGFADNAVYLGMDATNDAPEGRRSVRVSSSRVFNRGLIIADIVHMPGGICSTWPAFWMVGPDWPTTGEIDIFEGVNDQTANHMALHTGPGLVVSENQTFSGEMITSNCDVKAPGQGNNVGCGVADSDNSTYGAGFNLNGGGVYATEWTSAAIKIFFFPRGAVPADIVSGNPQPSKDWGIPRATFAGNVNLDNHFKDLKIVFDTTFCGDWAGKVWGESSCAALAPTCEEFVASNSTAFRDAYWAINSVKVFENGDMAMNETASLKTRSGGAVLPPRLP